MWTALALQLCAQGVAGQEIDPLPEGTWHPLQIAIAQQTAQGGGWTEPLLMVDLQFDYRDGEPSPHYVEYERVRQRAWHMRWMLDCTVDVQLLADGTEFRYLYSNPAGALWPVRMVFWPQPSTAETLEFFLRSHKLAQEAFRTKAKVPVAGAELRIGALPFVFQRTEPSTFPIDQMKEVPDWRMGIVHNTYFSGPPPPAERLSKLLFRMTADADQDLMPYWLYTVTATLGDGQVGAQTAGITYSTEPGVAWLAIWLPVAMEDLPETFEVEIVGEYLEVQEEVSEETILELPMPALIR